MFLLAITFGHILGCAMMKTWIASAVIYQINLRSLAAREPRNAIEAAREKETDLSPLAYLTKHLPVIKKLGANVLYLMPPYPIGIQGRKGIGSPYSIRDFKAIEQEYGTIEEMAVFVRRAHSLRFKVIFDITPNHTARDHVWTATHPEYYVKTDEGDLFYDCDWSDTAKLDYTNQGLRREMMNVYDFWLSFLEGGTNGIDGFRLDMAHFINDKSFWNEAIPYLKGRHPKRELLFLAECYGMENNLDLFARGMDAAYDDDFFKVCVNYFGLDENGKSIVLPAHDTFKNISVASAFETALMQYESCLKITKDAPRLARYTDNHDEGRGLYVWGEGAVRAINELIFLSNHTIPFLLTGQEFGALNRPSIHDRLTPIGKRRRILRDGKIHEQEAVEFEGNLFARSAVDRARWYAFYQELIRTRLKTPELLHGNFTFVNSGEKHSEPERTVIAFERTYRRSAVRCVVNLGPAPRTIAVQGEFLYGQDNIRNGELKAFSSVVYRIDKSSD